MAAGGTELGFAYFAAAKFAGYTAFCRWAIQPQIEYAISLSETPVSRTIPAAWKAGAARALIGLAIGAIFGVGFWQLQFWASHEDAKEYLFFVLLIPVRVFEWGLLLRWIYKGLPLPSRSFITLMVVGILISFALDVIGIVCAFVMPGGAWVC
jgi:hypothetical protein